MVEIVHFVEAGAVDLETPVDFTFVEGSISTPTEKARIQTVRSKTRYLITLGACATTGGIQALRNSVNYPQWVSQVYAKPEFIHSLSTSTAIADHVKVDWELWGCPVSAKQVMDVIYALLSSASPRIKKDSVCLECKRLSQVCVMVTKGEPCMGPVTQTGCGALCPGLNRGCYACFGPSDNPNPQALGLWFSTYSNQSTQDIALKFEHSNDQAPSFKKAANYFKGIKIVKKD